MGTNSLNSVINEVAQTDGSIPQGVRPLILLVDDESSNLHVLTEALRADYEIAVATSGRSALEFLESGEHPGIILLDIMMPEMDGYEVCRRLKANPATQNIPVIFITALTDVASEEHGFELGAVDYIHKPLKLPLVRARVRTHMTVQGMLDQLLTVNTQLNEKIAQLDQANQILDQKADELQRIKSRQELFSRVFASTAEGIIVTDKNGKIEAVNRAFTRITGFSADEVVGDNPKRLEFGRQAENIYREMWRRLQESGHWSGEIYSRRKNGEIYPELRTMSAVHDDAGAVTHYVTVFSDISGLKQMQERIDFLTWHDALTLLPNRMLFLDRLDIALRTCNSSNSCSAALVIDLDGFRAINDAQGLLVGDTVLCEVARRLSGVVRADDTVARLASDEFAILLAPRYCPRNEAAQHALTVAEDIRAILAEPMECGTITLFLTCSTGIAIFPTEPGESAVKVLQNADTARDRSSNGGGNAVTFFEVSMGDHAKQAFLLAQELKVAISEQQLRVFLQMQVNADRCVVGAEALVRWQHPTRGLLAPAEFIPLADQSRLIIALDRWVLFEACRIINRLAKAGHPLRISVNISPRHFAEPDFATEILSILKTTGIRPDLLSLEVTEGLMIQNTEEVAEKMAAIHEHGVRFSIDDFGTGYSSLSYLKKLPIHELKIDQSFVRDAPNSPNDAVLIEMIEGIASLLAIDCVAEGVETEAHRDLLRKYPCMIQQGYLYDMPTAAESWIKRYLESCSVAADSTTR